MNWTAMLGLAVDRFDLSPPEFWRMSLREWRMLTGPGEPAAMKRIDLERLVQQWPDEGRDDDRTG